MKARPKPSWRVTDSHSPGILHQIQEPRVRLIWKFVGSDCCWHRGPTVNGVSHENRARKARKHCGDEKAQGWEVKTEHYWSCPGPAAECIPGDDVESSRAPQAAAGLSEKASHSMTEDLSVGSFLNKGAATHPHWFHQRKIVLPPGCSITLKPKLRRAVGAGPVVLDPGQDDGARTLRSVSWLSKKRPGDCAVNGPLSHIPLAHSPLSHKERRDGLPPCGWVLITSQHKAFLSKTQLRKPPHWLRGPQTFTGRSDNKVAQQRASDERGQARQNFSCQRRHFKVTRIHCSAPTTSFLLAEKAFLCLRPADPCS